MKRYCIKCRAGKIEFFDIITETDDGYTIRLTKLSDGHERIVEEKMTRNLFETCLNTGYIFEMENARASVA
jgi:hypothetical protein